MFRRACSAVASYLGFGTVTFCGSHGVNVSFLLPCYPSKSCLIHKHIVKQNKHISSLGSVLIFGALSPSKSGLIHKLVVKHISTFSLSEAIVTTIRNWRRVLYRETYRVSFLVPFIRRSQD
jgi:hypothetical protein